VATGTADRNNTRKRSPQTYNRHNQTLQRLS
jgi:hypothetical protein